MDDSHSTSGSSNPQEVEVGALTFILERYPHIQSARKIIFFDCVIKGYDYFGMMHPLTGTLMPMNLVWDDTNIIDTTAICVKIPNKDFFKGIDVNVPTRRGQLVGDVLGKICGRVPRNVAAVLAPHFKTGRKDVLTHAFVFSGNFQ